MIPSCWKHVYTGLSTPIYIRTFLPLLNATKGIQRYSVNRNLVFYQLLLRLIMLTVTYDSIRDWARVFLMTLHRKVTDYS